MRNLAKICAVAVLCLGVTGGISTARTPLSKRVATAGRSRPVAAVAAPEAPLTFDKVVGPGPTRLKAETTVRVAANRPFHLMASFRGLMGGAVEKAAIPPKLMKVTINGKEVPVGTRFVEIAAGGPTPPAGVDVPVVVEIKTAGASAYPAGRYEGNLAVTVRGG